MRYLVLVSHGTLAQGVHSVLKMLAGENPRILSASLEDGMSAEQFVERFRETVSVIGVDDEVLLLGDIVGGSPLTNAANVLQERGLLAHAAVLGGVNLPMAMTAAMQLDGAELADVAAALVSEARDGVRILEFAQAGEEDEEDL